MKERIFEAKKNILPDVLAFLECELEKVGCDLRTHTALCIAMEEIFVNIADYAYPESGGAAKIAIDVDEEACIVTICVCDAGIAFDPLKRADPDVAQSAERREVGGLGIFIVKKTMDSVAYVRKNGENRLTMTKKWEAAEQK